MRFRIVARGFEPIEIDEQRLVAGFADWLCDAGRDDLRLVVERWLFTPYDRGGLGMAVPDDLDRLCALIASGWRGDGDRLPAE